MLAVRDLWATPAGAPDPVVRGVSFEVRPGEWLAVTGSNGCGKTTLAIAAAGLLPPSRGTVEWAGRPAADGAVQAGPGPILAILQDPGTQLLQPTVAEELRFTASNLGLDPAGTDQAVSRLVARLGLEGLEGLDPRSLSAGGQQLVLIAGALAARPGLLVADEPCAHLDAEARRRVIDLVAEEVAAGMAVIWVTQGDEERAAATRVLQLESPPLVPGEDMARVVRGPVVQELEVAPDRGSPGPRVRTPVPMRVEVRGPGLVALEGPNGSGKSVLLSAACGVLTCPQIRVVSRGVDQPLLASQYPEMLIFHERVEEELVYAATARGMPLPEALDAAAIMLRRLAMDARRLMGMSAWDLSTGEKRLIELVAVLIAPAGLVALDEPTGGLDPVRRRVVAGLVRERALQSAVLVASQDRAWLDLLGADRILIGGNRGQPQVFGEKSD